MPECLVYGKTGWILRPEGSRMGESDSTSCLRAPSIRVRLWASMLMALFLRSQHVAATSEGVVGSLEPSLRYRHRDSSNAVPAAISNEDFLTFCVDFDKLPENLSASQDYRVVAVTGCQCSGKSTLLNALFGTGFPVLERADGTLARRTTVGAWVDMQLCSSPRKTMYRSQMPGKADMTNAVAGTERSAVIEGAQLTTADSKSLGELDAGLLVENEGDDTSRAENIGATRHLPTPVTPFVLVDMEGTQSRDRGAHSMEFDSRTTLFTVMAADVIILNLWAHDVERADGQTVSVLRSVFEEAVHAYGSVDEGDAQDGGEPRSQPCGGPSTFPKTTPGTHLMVGNACIIYHRYGVKEHVHSFYMQKVLMLVLRDVEDDAQFETLERAARDSVGALWRDIDRPDSLGDASLAELFDVRTAGLPHFKYQRREFASKASDLSRSFLDPTYGGFVFSREPAGARAGEEAPAPELSRRSSAAKRGDGGRKAVVPLSMMRRRLEDIWASASTNRRLSEVPRRGVREGAVVLASLAESCLLEARPRCAKLLADVEAAAAGTMPLLQFGSDAKSILEGALRSFKSRASRSQSSVEASTAVVKEKREWLVAAVGRELEPAFRAHAQQLREHFYDEFDEAFSCVLGAASDFDESSRRMAKTARKSFLDAIQLAVPDLPGVADVWRLHWEAEVIKLDQGVEVAVQDRRAEGTWMLPPDPAELQAAASKKAMPWWKGLLLRGAVMYFNYLQATQHLRRAKKASDKRERAFPRLPLF